MIISLLVIWLIKAFGSKYPVPLHVYFCSVSAPLLRYLIHFCSTAAQIGFEQTVYSVDEEAGQVTVFVRLLSGELTSDVVIRLNTQDGSATSSGT